MHFDYLLAMDRANLEDLQEIRDEFDKKDHAKLGKGCNLLHYDLSSSAIIWGLSRSRVKDW
jgi:hypothetical protein